uniref:Uncharacterized protein n=1 Tax=Lepeophtheirus salmonis TaxID=72036 RepID=A0A0K2UYP3_LEPSM
MDKNNCLIGFCCVFHISFHDVLIFLYIRYVL